MPLEQYPQVRPVPGLVLDMYSMRRDLPLGIRTVVCYKAGRKFFHMFYAPQLMAFKLTHAQWATTYMAPLLRFDARLYKDRIVARMAQYDRAHAQYSTIICNEVLRLELTCGHELFGVKDNGQ